jgi:hypothetical protein
VTVPVTGPTLAYIGDTVGTAANRDTSFNDFSGATGEPVDIQRTFPTSLNGYRCVVLDLNQSFADTIAAELLGYLGAGGTILALGDHGGAPFDTVNTAMNGLATSLGTTGMSLNGDALDFGPHVTSAIEVSPLTENVFNLGDNWVSSITVGPPAQTLVNAADDPTAPIVAVQQVGPGNFVMVGDSDLFTDDNTGVFISNWNDFFARNLCP